MSTDPRRGLTRGGPKFNEVVAERIAGEQTPGENKNTGINAGTVDMNIQTLKQVKVHLMCIIKMEIIITIKKEITKYCA